jgi:hypothetical protein
VKSKKSWIACCVFVLAVSLGATVAVGADIDSLKAGKADLKSASALAFGREGILFVGDSMGAALFALDTGERTATTTAAPVDIKGINQKIAAALGTTPDQILVNDAMVSPVSKKIYLAVSRGRGPDAKAVIMRVDASGRIEELSLENIRHAVAPLASAPSNVADARGRSPRLEAITDLAYVEGKVFIAGLSNEEFSSSLRSIPFPFTTTMAAATGIEIYHGSHGRFETNAPIRTFVPYQIGNRAHILAAYTCTPLVTIPVSDLQPGSKVKGVTISELGSGNRPLDMITYTKGGKHFLLMANSSHGVMKLSAEGLDAYEKISSPIPDTKGVPIQTIADLKGVVQLDKYDEQNALILSDNAGSMDLRTVALP